MKRYSPLLVVKKLRYYARYIVVCLLLNRRSLVVELVEELQTIVDEYVREFKPADAAAWRLVLQEINLFLQVRVLIHHGSQLIERIWCADRLPAHNIRQRKGRACAFHQTEASALWA